MAWLAGWSNRVKLTIDKDDIDAILSNFPILLYISDSSGINAEDITFVFDEVGANSLKIAVTTSDGETECYVEVDKWDLGNEKAWLWVKVPSVSNVADTDLYLYYDNTHADNNAHVGVTDSVVAESVWDANFKFVCHMRDNPDNSNVRDSTGNDYDGAKGLAGEPTLITNGMIDDAQNFDGGDQIDVADSDGLKLANVTVEAWVKPSVAGTVFAKGDYQYGGYGLFQYFDSVNDVFRGQLQIALGTFKFQDTDVLDGGVWNYTAFTFNDTTKNIYAYRNATEFGPANATASIYYTGTPFLAQIGRRQSAVAPFSITADIDEVRISNIVRNASWLKASCESGRDNLLDWGAEEEPPVALLSSGTIVPLMQVLDML